MILVPLFCVLCEVCADAKYTDQYQAYGNTSQYNQTAENASLSLKIKLLLRKEATEIVNDSIRH
jgi:hypothetical protein